MVRNVLFQSLKCWLNIELSQIASTLRTSPFGVRLLALRANALYSVSYRVKSKHITAGQIACREMAQLSIDQSNYCHNHLLSYWHPPFILSFWMIHNPLLTQLVLVSPVYFVFSLIMRIAHVWHSLSANIQDPHLVQRMTGSWVSIDSAKFFVPMAWHLRHWKTLNPSWESYPSSQINSELAEQKLHLNLTKFSCPTSSLEDRRHSCIDTP